MTYEKTYQDASGSALTDFADQSELQEHVSFWIIPGPLLYSSKILKSMYNYFRYTFRS